MNNLKSWTPKDVISVIIILACFVLLGMGRDSYISWTLLAVVAAYYGINLGFRPKK
ncbi:hypothetical protein LCGC14_0848590 [marine sediment metagenome]|uniref:Uncharacterized protein n=1 Tax=marine sediment metagenome TaxID=412755 RepID=A0A0F9SI26_9ZZZZ